MHFKVMKIFVIGMVLFALICSSETMNAQDQTIEIMNRAIDQAKKCQGQITLSEETNKEAEAVARKAFDRFQSQEFQEKIDAETERIEQTFFRPFSPETPRTETPEKICPDRLPATEKIFLFISSSMPVHTLRTYVQDMDILDDPNFVIVLRGFVGGMKYVRPTLDFLEKLIVREKNCRLSEGNQCNMFHANIQIDPLIFGKLDIQQVPAVAYVKNIKKIDVQQSMGREGNLVEETDAVVVYGDASLDFALERIFNETGNIQIKKAIQKLRGDFYEG